VFVFTRPARFRPTSSCSVRCPASQNARPVLAPSQTVPAPLFLAPHRADAPCSAQPDIPSQGMGEHPLRVKSASPARSLSVAPPSGQSATIEEDGGPWRSVLARNLAAHRPPGPSNIPMFFVLCRHPPYRNDCLPPRGEEERPIGSGGEGCSERRGSITTTAPRCPSSVSHKSVCGTYFPFHVAQTDAANVPRRGTCSGGSGTAGTVRAGARAGRVSACTGIPMNGGGEMPVSRKANRQLAAVIAYHTERVRSAGSSIHRWRRSLIVNGSENTRPTLMGRLIEQMEKQSKRSVPTLPDGIALPL